MKRKIICLCGSTRFMDEFREANRKLSLLGYIVLTVEVVTSKDDAQTFDDPTVKHELDQLHFDKIDLADEILVLNKDGYIGYSTTREIAYAMMRCKRIGTLEPGLGKWIDANRERIFTIQNLLRGRGQEMQRCAGCVS